MAARVHPLITPAMLSFPWEGGIEWLLLGSVGPGLVAGYQAFSTLALHGPDYVVCGAGLKIDETFPDYWGTSVWPVEGYAGTWQFASLEPPFLYVAVWPNTAGTPTFSGQMRIAVDE